MHLNFPDIGKNAKQAQWRRAWPFANNFRLCLREEKKEWQKPQKKKDVRF